MSGYSPVTQGQVNALHRFSPRTGRRWFVLIGVVSVFLFFIFIAGERGVTPSSVLHSHAASKNATTAFFHLLIPADHKDVNLCKTMVSAGVAGFSSPTLINWGAKFDNPDLVAGGSHLAKINGVLSYLEKLGPGRDNDLVLIVDGYDIWFQLRPSTLIERYHAINNAANKRIRREMGAGAMEAEGIRQSILFSAQKRCWPWKEDDPPCFAVPESSLPADAYGPKTDTDIGFEKNPYVKFRQRYLNSGNAMGPVGDLRALFKRAKEKAEVNPNFGSDQKILSEIFGDQEFQREVMRARHRTFVQRMQDWFTGRKSFLDPHPTRHLRDRLKGKPNEFSIGLDYASLLGHPTVFAEEDSEWVAYNDTANIKKVSQDLDISPPRVKDLPSDIASSQPPFRLPVPHHSLPVEQPWHDVPLYSNMWTAVVPGLIHHNAHRDGLKKLRETVWDRMWYYPHLRALYDSVAEGPVAPIAVVNDSNGKEQSWWSPIIEKKGAMSDGKDWLEWKELCGEFEGKLFGEAG